MAGIEDWFACSALRPWLAPLDHDERAVCLNAWPHEIRAHDPESAGRVLLPFPRSFLVAAR